MFVFVQKLGLIVRMDNLHLLDASHSDKDSKDKNTVHKRRSSVFQSRTIVFDNDEG